MTVLICWACTTTAGLICIGIITWWNRHNNYEGQ